MRKLTEMDLLLEIPLTIRQDIAYIESGRLNKKYDCLRITMDRLLTETEKNVLKENPYIRHVDSVCSFKYAPELKKSVFYITY